MISTKTRHKRDNNVSAAGAFLENGYTKSHGVCGKTYFRISYKTKTAKGPTFVKTNELYSQIPQTEIVRNALQVLPQEYLLRIFVWVLSNGYFFKHA